MLLLPPVVALNGICSHTPLQVAAGKDTQLRLEDTVLRLLAAATGSLLDNVELIETLDQSKATWEEVNESLRVAEETACQIEAASAQYRPCSIRAAILYFVLNDLASALQDLAFKLDSILMLSRSFLSSAARRAPLIKQHGLQWRLPGYCVLHPCTQSVCVHAQASLSAINLLIHESCCLAGIDPMYQFSLDAYSSLFLLSIQHSPKSEVLADRIKALNDYHTYAVYKYAARGLFERHKLLLSLQLCVRVHEAAGQVNAEEWQFLLRGGQVGPAMW